MLFHLFLLKWLNCWQSRDHWTTARPSLWSGGSWNMERWHWSGSVLMDSLVPLWVCGEPVPGTTPPGVDWQMFVKTGLKPKFCWRSDLFGSKLKLVFNFWTWTVLFLTGRFVIILLSNQLCRQTLLNRKYFNLIVWFSEYYLVYYQWLHFLNYFLFFFQ